nr:bifunctional folylpolyglutamate synthase/dihydrofolate synthase [Bacteroidales bacterium]
MNYDEIISRIFTALPMYHKIGSSAYKEGLENIEALTEMVGHPERRLKCIHVAGTNGKGSVSNLLSSFYQELGLKVGLYTSPHLVDFRERIRVN